MKMFLVAMISFIVGAFVGMMCLAVLAAGNNRGEI